MKITRDIVLILVALLVGYSTAANAAEVYADLSWTPPSTRTDGTPLALTDLGGYRVYQSADGLNYLPIADLTDPTITAYTATSEQPIQEAAITLYFSVTAYDVDGLESAHSEVVAKTFLLESTAQPSAPGNVDGSMRCGPGCVVTEQP